MLFMKFNKIDNNNNMQEISDRDIGIVGISIKLPGANSLDEFWDNLKNKKVSITSFPEERRDDIKDYLNLFRFKRNTEEEYKAGYIKNIDKFDYSFFGISQNEANFMDPRQRLFLEVAYSCMEDSGFGGDALIGSNTGIFVGMTPAQRIVAYCDLLKIADEKSLYNLGWAGTTDEIIASRIAYLFDFRGPNMLVNTTCSSSLVALHLACQAIRNNECDQAIVGGISLNLVPLDYNQKLAIDSFDNKTRSFDNNSDGTGWGEGIIAIMIKSLSKAIADNDYVHAVIKGSAINQDGKSLGLIAPNARAQTEVIEKAWKDSGINPTTISYIEAHGTGTKIGDPIEVEGISKAFEKYTNKKQFCAISSVKANIGHLNSAAGLAGLVKAVLMLKHKMLIPQPFYEIPNENIFFEDSSVYVNDRLTEWKKNNFPRRCGVSSFGMSGTNSHVILEEAPEDDIFSNNLDNKVLTISAVNAESLNMQIINYYKFLTNNKEINLFNFCYTNNIGKKHHGYRVAIVFKNYKELLKKIEIIMSKEKNYYKYNIFHSQYMVKNKRNMRKVTYEKKANQEILKNICHYYVSGGRVDWKEFYKKLFNNIVFKKTSIPKYVFSSNRCWFKNKGIKININNSSLNSDCPLLDELKAETHNEFVFSKIISKQTWEIGEHSVSDKEVMVGTAYIEMVVEAFNELFDENRISIKEVVFLSPLIINDDEKKEVQVILRKNEGGYDFLINSRTTESEKTKRNAWNKHVQGMIFELKESKKNIDIDTIKREAVSYKKEKLFPLNINFSFSERWNNIKKVFIGKDRIMLYIKADLKYEKEISKYFFHPALVDSSLTDFKGSTRDLSLPLSYGQIKIFKKVPHELFSVINEIKDKENKQFKRYNVMLIDNNGDVVVEIEDYVVKKVDKNFNKEQSDSNISNKLYEFFWKEIKIEKYKYCSCKNEKILVFKHDNDLDLCDNIKKLQDGNVVEIILGKKFKKISQNFYEINCAKIDNFKKIFNIISGVKKIIFLGGIEINNYDAFDLKQLDITQNVGVFSLMKIIKSLNKVKQRRGMELIVVTNDAYQLDKDEKVYPFSGSICGFIKMIPREYAYINVCHVDISSERVAKYKNKHVGDLLNRQYFENYNFVELVFRKGKLYKKEIRDIDISKLDEVELLKKKGVYIIIGGAGGLGYEISKFLSEKYKARIILIGRREINDEIRGKIKKLNNFGGNAFYYQGDITRYSDMKKITDRIKNKFKRINGVIHSAVVLEDRLIENMDDMSFRKSFDPKVRGSVILGKIFKKEKLDFLVFFSSFASLVGNIGQSNYVAGNAFMDAFGKYLMTNFIKNTKIFNWSFWGEAGVAVDVSQRKIMEKKGIYSFTSAEGVGIFEKIMTKRINQVVVIKMDERIENNILIKLTKNIEAEESNKSTDDQDKIIIEGRNSGKYSDIEITIAKIWCKFLGYKKINISDNFFDIGGDSLLMMQIYSEIEKKFPGSIIPADLFNLLTIDEQAQYFEKVFNKKIEKKKLHIGGTPFTAINDWLYDNNSKDYSRNKSMIVENVILNFDILNKILIKLNKYFKDINFSLITQDENSANVKFSQKYTGNETFYTYKEKDDTLQGVISYFERTIRVKKFKMTIFLSPMHSDLNYKIFIGCSNDINSKEFLIILRKLQEEYNKELIGVDEDSPCDSTMFFPYYSYPLHDSCVYSDILELIKFYNSKVMIYKSLMPALDFYCLPNYYIVDNKIKFDNNDYNSVFLGYGRDNSFNSLDILGIKHKIINLNSRSRAEEYLEHAGKINKNIIIVGTSYQLPFARDYRDLKFIDTVIKRNAKHPINFVILGDTASNNPIVYSANFNFFGRIEKNNLFKYWEGLSAIPELNNVAKLGSYPTYGVLEIENINKINIDFKELFLKALKVNVEEFYNNKKILGKKNDHFKNIYFGRQVIEIFKNDILDSMSGEENITPDIVIVDLIKKLQRPYFFFHDLLLDMEKINKKYSKELGISMKIIEKWDDIFSKFYRIIKKKNIKYEPRVNALVNESLYFQKILSKKDKIMLINVLEDISFFQDKLFLSLKNKVYK